MYGSRSAMSPLAWVLGVLCALATPTVSQANTYWVSSSHILGQPIIGENYQRTIYRGDTLSALARENGLGLQEILDANPGVSPRRLRIGQSVIVPGQHILPNTGHDGLVVNLPEMRVYRFVQDGYTGAVTVSTYPVTIGRARWSTPIKVSTITEKTANPYWYPTKSIIAASAKKGIYLPKAVPPGPKNPLGKFKIRIGRSPILFHGTNNPGSIGLRASHGCLRMYPEDIEELFYNVNSGEQVQIISQPIKLTIADDAVWIEVHKPVPNDPWSEARMLRYAKQYIDAWGFLVDDLSLKQIIKAKTGMPTRVLTQQLVQQQYYPEG